MTFRKRDRLMASFMEAAGGSFMIVYLALSACAKASRSSLLKEADVLAAIEKLKTPKRGHSMTTMIERIAQATREAVAEDRGRSVPFEEMSFIVALAALKAMREPTVEMEVAGTEQWLCEVAMEDRSGANWRAMIDAAIEEHQQGEEA